MELKTNMRKYLTVILSSFLVAGIVSAFTPATLFIETWNGIKKQAVYSQEQADKLFKDGYKLFQGEALGGVAYTTISGSDTMKNFPTTYNANNALFDAGKIDVGITSVASITTLSNLATVGTITSGVWSGTAISVAKGGTGLTSPTLYYVPLGNGASGFTFASSTGTTGQFLTSNGAGAYPSWQLSTVNQASIYNWTGSHYFTASTTNSATTTIAASSVTNNALVLNGQAYTWPTSQNASSSILMTDGVGTLSWQTASSTIRSMCATGQASQAINTTGEQTLTHSLGVKPTYFSINALYCSAGNPNTCDTSNGTSGSATSTQSVTYTRATETSQQATQSTTYIVYINAAGAPAYAKLWAVDYNTFSINWTANPNSGNPRLFQWTVCR